MNQVRAREAKLYVRIAKEIRDQIENGSLLPGDKLRPLAELAVEFQCSRATVREALGALRGQGLVEFRHGDGTYVRTATIDMWMEPLDAALLLAGGHAQQLMEFTATVLSGVAAVAATRRTANGLAHLAQALFRLECADRGAEESVTAELSFYLALASCADNALMENAVRVLQEALRSQLRLIRTGQSEPVVACRDIYDAVMDRDAERARDIAFQAGMQMVDEVLQTRPLKVE